jgi:hypothetical protein
MLTLKEMIREAVSSREGVWTYNEIKEYIKNKWPDQNTNPRSIDDQIEAACVNFPARTNYPENSKNEVDTPREKYDFLFWIGRGKVELYDPSKHGKWGIAFVGGEYRIYRDPKPLLGHSTPKCCYSIIYSTNSLWLKNVKKLDSDIVNFWSPRDKELDFKPDHFFFKTIDKTIAGYATLKKIETMTAGDAWNKFGELNGAESEDEFLHMIPATKDKKIKCIILENPVFFETPLKLADCGIPKWRFSDKYLDEWETNIIWNQVREFDPVDETNDEDEVGGKINQSSIIEGRPYQNRLKQKLIEIYGGKCAICDMDVQQLLRASHIIPHSKNKKTAKRLDNAILLCSLHDSLFDKGLITIIHNNGTYGIEVSSELHASKSHAVNELCEHLAKAKFREPTRSPPSDESLRYHNSEIFEK